MPQWGQKLYFGRLLRELEITAPRCEEKSDKGPLKQALSLPPNPAALSAP